MGNKVDRSLDYQKYSTSDLNSVVILTKVDKAFIVRAWKKLGNKHDFFLAVWIKSVQRVPEIREIFGISRDEPDEDLKANSRIIAVARSVTAFFRKIIDTDHLNTSKLVIECKALGERHINYNSNGFNLVHWDIFTVCLQFQLENTLKCKSDTLAKYVYTWHKLMGFITEYMRLAYKTNSTSN